MKLSVMVITYNHERFIGQALESVLAQRGLDFRAGLRLFRERSVCPSPLAFVVRGTVVDNNYLDVVAVEGGYASDGLGQEFAVIETWNYNGNLWGQFTLNWLPSA